MHTHKPHVAVFIKIFRFQILQKIFCFHLIPVFVVESQVNRPAQRQVKLQKPPKIGEFVIARERETDIVIDQQGKIQFHPTYHDETLVSPSVQASIIRYTRTDQPEFGGRSRILFSNPNHPKARYNLTVRLSYDEGKTWPVSKVVDPGPSAYSDLVIQNDMKIGLIYERGNQGGISYVNFTLDWLTDGQDALKPEY